MKNLKFLNVLYIFIITGLLIFLTFFVDFKSFTHHKSILAGRAYLFSHIEVFSSLVSELKKINSLMEENLFLKDENRKLLSQLAFQSELEEQNKFFREALGVGHLKEYGPIEAGIFNILFTPDGHYALINRGSEERVKKEDVIVTSSGILVGQIVEVFDSFSRVALITDSDFKITVKLLNKNTLGISHGMLSDEVWLDFIFQNDEVVKGDVVVTNGNDLFPPGLIVGVVNKISSDDGSLFKKVLVKPEFKNINLSRVLILNI